MLRVKKCSSRNDYDPLVGGDTGVSGETRQQIGVPSRIGTYHCKIAAGQLKDVGAGHV